MVTPLQQQELQNIQQQQIEVSKQRELLKNPNLLRKSGLGYLLSPAGKKQRSESLSKLNQAANFLNMQRRELTGEAAIARKQDQIREIDLKIKQKEQQLNERRDNLHRLSDSGVDQETLNRARKSYHEFSDLVQIEIGELQKAKSQATGEYTTESVIRSAESRADLRLLRGVQKRQFEKLNAERLKNQQEAFKREGLEPVYENGKIIAFKDSRKMMSYEASELGKYRGDALNRLVGLGIINVEGKDAFVTKTPKEQAARQSIVPEQRYGEVSGVLFQDFVKYDRFQGNNVPIYSEVKFKNEFTGEVRSATPDETKQFIDSLKAQKYASVAGTEPKPRILRVAGETLGAVKKGISTIDEGLRTTLYIDKLPSNDETLNKLSRTLDSGDTIGIITKNFLPEVIDVNKISKVSKPVANFLPEVIDVNKISKIKQFYTTGKAEEKEIRAGFRKSFVVEPAIRRPFSGIILPATIGFELGLVAETIMISGAAISPSIGTALTSVELGVGGFILTKEAVSMGQILINKDISSFEKGESFGEFSRNFLLFGGGYSAGSKLSKNLFVDLVGVDIPFVPELTISERFPKKQPIRMDDRLVASFPAKSEDLLIAKAIQQQERFIPSVGTQKVFIPKAKRFLAELGYPVKPTYIGTPYGGELTYTSAFGTEATISISRAEALKQRTKILDRLEEELGYSRNQAEQYVRLRTPKKIKVSLAAEAFAFQSESGEIVNIKGTQKNIPQKEEIFGSVDLDGLIIETSVKTGGQKAIFNIEENLLKGVIPKKPPIKGMEGKPEIVTYTGERITTGGRLKYAEVNPAFYKIKSKEAISVFNPDLESAQYAKLLKQEQLSAYFELTKTGRVSSKQASVEFSKSSLVLEKPDREVVVFQESPMLKAFDIRINDYLQELKLTSEGINVGEIKEYKLIEGKEQTAQSLPFVPEFKDTYELVAKEDIIGSFKAVAPRAPTVVQYEFKDVKRLIGFDEQGFVKVAEVSKAEGGINGIKRVENFDWLKGTEKKETFMLDKAKTERATSLSFDDKRLSSLLAGKLDIETIPLLGFRMTPRGISRTSFSQRGTTESAFFSVADLRTEGRTENRLDIKIESKLEPKIDLRIEPRVDSLINLRSEPKIDLRLEPRLEAKLEPKLETKLEPKIELEIVPEIIPEITLSPLPSPKPPIIPRGRTKRKDDKKRKKAFTVFVKRRGKFVPVAKGLPRGRALQRGADIVEKELSRQFKLLESGFTTEQDISFAPRPETFRPYKVRKGKKIPFTEQRFIQRTAKSLGTPEEKELIRQAKIMSQFR